MASVEKYHSAEIESVMDGLEQAKVDQINSSNDAANEITYTPSGGDLMTAAMAVKTATHFVEQRFKPATFDEKFSEEATEKLAVILSKYGADWPPWIKQLMDGYKEEIDFAILCGGAAFGVWRDHQKYQREQAAAEKAKREALDNGH